MYLFSNHIYKQWDEPVEVSFPEDLEFENVLVPEEVNDDMIISTPSKRLKRPLPAMADYVHQSLLCYQ